MQTPALHSDESARLDALRDLRILDTPTEERFDPMRLTAMRRRPGLLYGQHLYTHY